MYHNRVIRRPANINVSASQIDRSNTWIPASIAAADLSLYDSSPGDASSFDVDASTFEAGDDHPLADLINAIDPSAFSDQVTTGITGTLSDGGYLVPENFLGYVATDLDYFALNPTGLDYLLGPVIDLLLGSRSF